MLEKYLNTWRNFRESYQPLSDEFNDAQLSVNAASISFHALFSIIPLLFVILLGASFFLDKHSVQNNLLQSITNLFGPSLAHHVQQIIFTVQKTAQKKWTTLSGIGALFLGASNIFWNVQKALRDIWLDEEKHKRIRFYLKARFKAFASVLLSIGLLAILTLATPLLSPFYRLIAQTKEMSVYLLFFVDGMISITSIILVLMIIYKILIPKKVQWKPVFLGALFSAILFVSGKFGVDYFLSRLTILTSFGAAAGLVILLIWVYYCSYVFLIGAVLIKLKQSNKKLFLKRKSHEVSS